MNYTVITYVLYLIIAIPITIWVARTLFKNGGIFLIDCFRGNERLAEAVNHLLVVGFYLVNIGFITLYLKLADGIVDASGVFEALSTKVGTVLLVLGGMHFFNIYIFNKMRKRGLLDTAPPPVAPDLRNGLEFGN
jgi:hypothetical protein